MDFVARQVLKDCYLAHEVMEAEKNHYLLRVEWIGALALLRLVGDALNKVDAKNRPELKQAVSAQHKLQNDDPIFRDFIKGARDRAVHEYSHDLLDVSEIPILIEHSDGAFEQCELDDCLFMPLTGNFRFGEDARDVYLDALKWWERHISAIEGKLA